MKSGNFSKKAFAFRALAVLLTAFFAASVPGFVSSASARGLKNFILRKQAQHDTRRGTPLSPSSSSAQAVQPNGQYWIKIDKSEHKLYLMNGGKTAGTFDAATGSNPEQKTRTGDNCTPEGTFSVMSIQDSRRWLHDFHDGKGVIENGYGPWCIKINTRRWYDISIHGTNDDSIIGRDVTDGSIRLHNGDMNTLQKHIKRGAKIVIIK